MKIIKIEKDPERARVYNVTFRKFKLFGPDSEFVEQFKESDEYQFRFRQSGYYLKPDGSHLSNGHWIAEAIDQFKRSW